MITRRLPSPTTSPSDSGAAASRTKPWCRSPDWVWSRPSTGSTPAAATISLAAYAVPTIMGEVRRHFRDTGWSMRVPRHLQELHALITTTVNTLSQELGRSPSASEIAPNCASTSARAPTDCSRRTHTRTLSMDRTLDDPDYLPLTDTLCTDDPELAHVESHAAVHDAREKLSPLDRRVLLLRFFGSLTQTEIAHRVGVSQMQVSRILTRILTALREQSG
nr:MULTISPECIES: sigma-70 family RNA polymerase sigma factor [unclassified Rhodococcus (in: high G+C Gram-positive bacteria)]